MGDAIGGEYAESDHDEIKVTVIAAGFEKSERMPENVRNLPVTKEEQDIPTIIRNRWQQQRFTKVRQPDAPESTESEYDIPGFFRRKAEQG